MDEYPIDMSGTDHVTVGSMRKETVSTRVICIIFTLFAVSHFLMVAGAVPLAIRQCQMAIADFVMLCQQAQKVLYCPSSKQDQSAYYFNYTLLSLYYRFRRILTTNSI